MYDHLVVAKLIATNYHVLVRGQLTIPFGTNESSRTRIALKIQLVNSASTRLANRYSATDTRPAPVFAKLSMEISI